jgi:hypothetical protein
MEEIMAQMASVQAALSVTRTTESTAPAVSPESIKVSDSLTRAAALQNGT